MNSVVPSELRDEFLSEEDLDLQNLSMEEIMACWDVWFSQAQETNDSDRWTYSHGVFADVPLCARNGTESPCRSQH
jgi:hypothetical protein